MKDKLTLFTKYLLDFMHYSGIFVIATLPFSIRFYGKYNSYFKNNYYSLLVVFFLSGIFAVLIINELRKMFRSVLNDDCFIRENVVSLEKNEYLQLLYRRYYSMQAFYLYNALRFYPHSGVCHCRPVQ